MLPVSQQQTTDDHIFLTGRPPLQEYLGFITSLTAGGADADRASLARDWRAANDHVRQLESMEAGSADDATVEPLPESLEMVAHAILTNPAIQQSYALMPISIGMVELERLVVYQKAINLGQIARVKARVGATPSEVDIFATCFPVDRGLDPEFGFQPGGNGWSFVSPSNDFRFLGGKLVEPAAVSAFDVQGAPVAMMVLAVGYGINVFAAALIEGRLILTNGSHRAYALLEAGITHAPCLVQNVSRREEIELLGIPDLSANPDLYLKAPRPPLLKDYFDPALRIVASVPRKDRHVQVAFNVNPMDLPASPR
ncbi:MAG TPA: hypothetical protein VFM96_13325 [Gaiellaceae bacterium]|nr:hypothetical protein [Gaiellaceae bacterium]